MIKIIVSSCLLGSPVRFDGRDKKSNNPTLAGWVEEGRVVAVCPEVLGGLGTPRPPAEIARGGDAPRVFTNEGGDVTEAFESGARTASEMATAQSVRLAILKDGSPSCGSSYVYDGTFRKMRVAGEGVTATSLRERGIAVFSEDQIDAAAAYLASLESPAS